MYSRATGNDCVCDAEFMSIFGKSVNRLDHKTVAVKALYLVHYVIFLRKETNKTEDCEFVAPMMMTPVTVANIAHCDSGAGFFIHWHCVPYSLLVRQQTRIVHETTGMAISECCCCHKIAGAQK